MNNYLHIEPTMVHIFSVFRIYVVRQWTFSQLYATESYNISCAYLQQLNHDSNRHRAIILRIVIQGVFFRN